MALKGVKIVELAGLAPVPFCGLILADFGADVIRVDRAGASNADQLCRGKRSIALDLKKKEAIDVLLTLISHSDILLDPFRPGVLEKLGVGPDVLHSINPKLIVARLTGFGQTGPFKLVAGHDINYISIGGILGRLGKDNEPHPIPINLLGDFAAGSLLCVIGILAALKERERSGRGQVVDCSMVDGSNYISSFLFAAKDIFPGPRGSNLLDGGAPFYSTYRTKDGGFIAVGAIEPQFYELLLRGLGLEGRIDEFPQLDPGRWEEMRQHFQQIIGQKTRAEWEQIFRVEGPLRDACVTPVLSPKEIASHPHHTTRKTFFHQSDDLLMPSPAPMLSRTPAYPSHAVPEVGEHSHQILQEIGLSNTKISALSQSKAIEQTGVRRALL